MGSGSGGSDTGAGTDTTFAGTPTSSAGGAGTGTDTAATGTPTASTGGTDAGTGSGTGTGAGSTGSGTDTTTGTAGTDDETGLDDKESVGRLVIVPWSALLAYADQSTFCFALQPSSLLEAPSTSDFELPDMSSEGWDREITGFWDEQTNATGGESGSTGADTGTETGSGAGTGIGSGSAITGTGAMTGTGRSGTGIDSGSAITGTGAMTDTEGSGTGIGSGSAITGTGAMTGAGTTGARGRGLVTQSGMVMQASQVMDTAVRNTANEELGEVGNLLVASDSGQVLYAVVSYGGFLGFNANQVAIPWGAFRFDDAENGFLVDIDMETLQNAPKLSELGPEGISAAGWDSAVQEFWRGHGLSAPGATGTGSGQEGAGGAGAGQGATGTPASPGSGAGATAARTGAQLLRADRLIGMNVRGMDQDAGLGDVSDLLVNLDAGQVIYVLLGSGGFLGIGQSVTAIPWEAFTMSSEDNTLVLDMTSEELGTAPQLNLEGLPETVDPNWDQNVRTWWQTRTSR
jgi:sporulation protein YlmC with PRC-barrel domain